MAETVPKVAPGAITTSSPPDRNKKTSPGKVEKTSPGKD
jgi:hypothetical protein